MEDSASEGSGEAIRLAGCCFVGVSCSTWRGGLAAEGAGCLFGVDGSAGKYGLKLFKGMLGENNSSNCNFGASAELHEHCIFEI